jgi:hypothetical protein
VLNVTKNEYLHTYNISNYHQRVAYSFKTTKYKLKRLTKLFGHNLVVQTLAWMVDLDIHILIKSHTFRALGDFGLYLGFRLC